MNIKKLTLIIFLFAGILVTQVATMHAMKGIGAAALTSATGDAGNGAEFNPVKHVLIPLSVVSAVYLGNKYRIRKQQQFDRETDNLFDAIGNKNNYALRELLHNNRALVERRKFDAFPLQEAVRTNNVPAVALLLAAGADANRVDLTEYVHGVKTPLNRAAYNLNKKLVGLLMASGADPFKTDTDTFVVLDFIHHHNAETQAQLTAKKNEIRALLLSPAESKKYVAELVQSDSALSGLPDSIKRDLLNRSNIGQMRQSVTTFMETGRDSALKYELNKDRWMFRHLTQAGQEKSWLSQRLTKQSGRRPALPADVVRYIKTFLDRNNIPNGELADLLKQTKSRVARTQNKELLMLTRTAQQNEDAVEKAVADRTADAHNKNSRAKWQAHNKGLNRSRKNEVNQHA